MPRSNWRDRFAIGLVALLALASEACVQDSPPVFQSDPKPEGQHATGAAPDTQNTGPKQQSTLDLLLAIQGVEAAIRDLISEEDEVAREAESRRDQADLRAQESMALWALVTAIANGIAAFLTGVGILLIWRTLHHTRRAADYANDMVDEARKTTQAAIDSIKVERAWITKSGWGNYFISNPIFDGVPQRGEALGIALHWRNDGRSPAINMKMTSDHALVEPGVGPPVFDGATDTGQKTASVGQSAVVKGMMRVVGVSDYKRLVEGSLSMYIYGKATYEDVFSRGIVRHTEVCCLVDLNGERVSETGERIPMINLMPEGPQNTIS